MRPSGFGAFARATGVSGVLLASLAAGCGGGGGSDAEVGARALYVVDMDLDGLDGVSLNVPMQIEFSDFVLPETIRPDTIQIRLGPRYGIQAFGDFKVAGNIVTFFPQIPTKSDLSDSGFKPQSQYRVTVAGHPKVDQVQAYTGRPLIRTFVGNFATAATTSPDLFTTDTYKDNPPPTIVFTNPPDVLPVSPWTTPGGAVNVPTDAEIQLVLNRVPLAPSTITVSNVSLTMIERLGSAQSRPIQGTPVVEQSFEGTTLRFVPAFPLADQARYVLRVENRVTDLTGSYDVADNAARTNLRSQAESGVDPALTAFALAHPEEVDPRTFLIFTTRDEPTKDLSVFNNFDGTDLDENASGGVNKVLTNADYNGAVPGAVAATFTAPGGNGVNGDFKPTANTTISTNSGLATNGIFNFQVIDIPANVTVSVTGTIPGSFLSLKSVNVAGTIGVAGTNGENASTVTYAISSPVFLCRGGLGGPGGGKGGDNDQGTTYQNFTNPPGVDAPNGGGKGGGGAQTPTNNGGMGFGGGGGGGGHQYAGATGGPGNNGGTASWTTGSGGAGGAASGIQPTSVATNDGKTFYQKGVGGGGGAPGATGFYSTNWRFSAAGGGGGGGAFLLKSAGDIRVSGRIISKGGNGGSGTGTSYTGGAAGGGGGGGTVAIYSNGALSIAAARLDAAGGAGGAQTGQGGPGGAGGGGFNQCEDRDGVIAGESTATLLPDMYKGSFDPTGTAADAPSVYVSTWFNTGVFDPILQAISNLDFTDQNYVGCSIKYELQMAIEDQANFGRANTNSINPLTQVSSDLTKASQFATFALKDASLGSTLTDISAQMNGKQYQFYRLRITFTLKDGQKRADPIPFVDRLRLRFQY